MQESFNKFFAQYNGQGNIGDTPENVGECVGLIEKWIDFLNLGGHHVWGNANQLLADADPKYFQIIYNTPDNVPQIGDIVVLSSDFNGTVGHTGISTGVGDTNTFELFEQNDPLGGVSQKKTYPYNNSATGKPWVLGWLRPIIATASPNPQGGALPPNYDEIITKAVEDDLFHNMGYFSPTAVKNIIDNLTQARDNAQKSYESEVEKNTALTTANTDLTKINTSLKVNVSAVTKQNTDLLGKFKEQTESDSTAIDEGLRAERNYNQIWGAFTDLAKTLQVNPTIEEVQSRVNSLVTIQKKQQPILQNKSRFEIFLDSLLRKKVS